MRMPVTPEVQNLLDMIAAVGTPPPAEQTPAEVREAYALLSSFTAWEDVGAVEDRVIPGPAGDIPVRAYRPVTASGPDGRPGVLVYFHGGGWSIGSIDTHDAVCRPLANGSGAVVVSVEYRLAPETPYPGPLDDCHDALIWVLDRADDIYALAATMVSLLIGNSTGRLSFPKRCTMSIITLVRFFLRWRASLLNNTLSARRLKR